MSETRSKAIRTGALAMASFLLVYLGLQHTPWRDEIQAWLVATQTQSWSEFFEAIRFERNPPLSYLLIRAIHIIGEHIPGWNAVWTLRAHAWPFALLSFGLLCFGFRRHTLALCAAPFGILFLREYGVLSRSYSMGACFLLLALFFKQKARMGAFALFLVLAAHTHLLFGCVVAGWLALEIWDRKPIHRIAPWMVWTCLGLALSALLQWPPSQSHYAQSLGLHAFTWTAAVANPAQGLTGLERVFLSADQPYVWNHNSFRFLSGTLLLALSAWWIGWRLFCRWVVSAALVFAVLQFGYGGFLRHQGFYFLAWLGVYLTQNPASRSRAHTWTAALIGLQALGCAIWIFAWKPFQTSPAMDFSGTREAISFLKKAGYSPDQVTLYTDDAIYAFGLIAEGNYRVVDSRTNERIRYPLFAPHRWTMTADQWCKKHRPLPNALWLTHKGPPPPACGFKRKIFTTTRPIVTDETVELYAP